MPKPPIKTIFNIEADPEKRKIAHRLVERFMQNPRQKFSRRKIRHAGTALANQFFFAVTRNDAGTLVVRFAPRKEPMCDGDVHALIGPLLRGSNELTDPAALANDLAARGFVWKRSFQEDYARSSTDNDAITAMLERTLLPHRVKEHKKT